MDLGTRGSEFKICWLPFSRDMWLEKDSIELVLAASKKAISNGVGALRNHEIVMSNFLDLWESTTLSPEGSAHDKHLKTWMENMQKIGAEV